MKLEQTTATLLDPQIKEVTKEGRKKGSKFRPKLNRDTFTLKISLFLSYAGYHLFIKFKEGLGILISTFYFLYSNGSHFTLHHCSHASV